MNCAEICFEVAKIIPESFLVGGAVRDTLLNKEPKDFDFATPLSPDEIETAIQNSGRHAYSIGKRFGTVGVKINGIMVEITTFRSEKYEEGNRKPQVEFVKDINSDLSRRDFTINAMARTVLPEREFIDLFNGQEDMKNKVIRCVGKPKDRFKEDPLRMLRVARFMSQLEFEVHPDTEETAFEMSYKILEVSKERWCLELDKLLMTLKPSLGLDFMMRTRLMNFMIPELSLQYSYNQNSPYHSRDLWEHTKYVVDNVGCDIMLRWAALLHDIAKPFVRYDNNKGYSNYLKHDMLGKEMVIRLAYYLKWSNERREVVSNLVLNHMLDTSPLKEADEKGK
jgi:tRNA nucleotidyltransferase (CCA-adding enzyme)